MVYLFELDIFASLRVPTVDRVDVNDTLFGMDCNCVPICSETIYEVETTICRRSKSSKLRSAIVGQTFDPENTTTLKIHFKDISCIKYRRELYLTWDGVFESSGTITTISNENYGNKVVVMETCVRHYDDHANGALVPRLGA
ncbi:hypothetical protein Bhyg_17164 [Pseudolycoriella hygida]|uniref:Uncharacterized protein n=1 Tax=Pseudolycoriella hygida TaxID=35572 RepID=A0A9Q0MHH1_9DIPT|nr:hypothetical protein Bhyg_17164 [Pseudolycoriella hygida]